MATRPVALISGASSGIGAATARRLAAAGWLVAVSARRLDRLEALATECGGVAIAGDLTEEAHPRRLVDAVVDRWGRLDGLVLSAGIMVPGAAAEVSPADWHTTIAVNLTAPLLLVQAALPRLVSSKGAVVAVASVGADLVGPRSTAYGVSKAGLVRMMRSVAVDYGPEGVRANVVNPGWIRSEMADDEMDALGVGREQAYSVVTRYVPARRPGSTQEAAAAIAWLLSPDASYINGAVIAVDGGVGCVSSGMVAFQPGSKPMSADPQFDV